MWHWICAKLGIQASARSGKSVAHQHSRLRVERLETRELMAGNILQNGSFEAWPVKAASNWDVFNTVPGWQVVDATGRPELQKQGLYGWKAAPGNGQQWMEMDGDENGPNVRWDENRWDFRKPITGRAEKGLFGIQQSFATEYGLTYTVTYDIAARPNLRLEENIMQVTVSDELGILFEEMEQPNVVGKQQPIWQQQKFTFVARGSSATLKLAGKGPDNTFGLFLDDVSVVESPREIDTTPIVITPIVTPPAPPPPTPMSLGTTTSATGNNAALALLASTTLETKKPESGFTISPANSLLLT